MRGFCLPLLSLALTALLSLTPPGGSGGTWYLRVVARDDTPAAQAEKLRVRDAVLAACPWDAAVLPRSLPALARAAREITPCCRVTLKSWSPNERTPAAPTVYVTIGRAEGKNWWGVLYEDSLLLAQADDQPEEQPIEGVVFLWPWLAWLRGLLFGD